MPCNKKFIYRDVKHDLTIKLEVVDNDQLNKANLQEEMEQEELTYNRLLNELRNFKEMKIQQLEVTKEIASQGTSNQEVDSIQRDIKKAMDDKDHLAEILHEQQRLNEEKARKIEQFTDDLTKM